MKIENFEKAKEIKEKIDALNFYDVANINLKI